MSALAEKPAADPALENAPEWVPEALSLRQQGLSEREIAESVGKAASTVHAALKKYDGAMSGTPVSPEQAARLKAAAEGGSEGGAIPGQTTIDGGEVPTRDALHNGEATVIEPEGAHEVCVHCGDDFPAPIEAHHSEEECEATQAEMGAERERPAAAVALEAEAGPAVGPMPPRKPQETVIYVEEIRVDGTKQGALNVGGKRAGSATCSVKGKLVVDGSFAKGDVFTGTFRAVIREVASKDKVDKKTGVVTEAVDRFVAELVDLVPASENDA